MHSNPVWTVIRVVVWSVAGLTVLLALSIGVTAATLPGCTLCHQSPAFVAQTRANPHANISCVRCHVSPGVPSRIEYAYHMVFGMALHVSPVRSGPVAGIENSTCLSCHSDVMKKVVSYGGISVKHSDCSKGRQCTECHSNSAHGTAVKWQTTATMDVCLDCHDSTRVRSNCTTCHAERSMAERMSTGQWQITHGSNWKQTHGMGDLKTCGACHTPDYCANCHGIPLPHNADFLKVHPAFALSNRSDCEVCHKQAFCDKCHGLPMPHPAGFTPTHPTLVKRLGQSACMRCHLQEDCTNCHIKHVHPGGATLPPKIGLP